MDWGMYIYKFIYVCNDLGRFLFAAAETNCAITGLFYILISHNMSACLFRPTFLIKIIIISYLSGFIKLKLKLNLDKTYIYSNIYYTRYQDSGLQNFDQSHKLNNIIYIISTRI